MQRIPASGRTLVKETGFEKTALVSHEAVD